MGVDLSTFQEKKVLQKFDDISPVRFLRGPLLLKQKDLLHHTCLIIPKLNCTKIIFRLGTRGSEIQAASLASLICGSQCWRSSHT